MGGSGSKSFTEIMSSAIINVSNSVSMSQGQAVTGVIKIAGSVEGGRITQSSRATQSNISNINFDNDVINKIMADVKQQAEASSSVLTAAIAKNNVKLHNTLSTILNNDFKNSVAQSVSNLIEVTSTGVVKNVAIDQDGSAVQKAVTDYLSKNVAWNNAANEVEQVSSSSASLLNLGMGGNIVLILICLVLLYLGYRYMSSPSSSSTPTHSNSNRHSSL